MRMVTIFLALLIVIAIFGLVIAVLFDLYPEAVFPVWMEIPIALLLGLPRDVLGEGVRESFLVAGFAVVFFSLVVQGLTVGPLIRILGLRGEEEADASDPS